MKNVTLPMVLWFFGFFNSLVLTKRKTHQEISNVSRERYPDMRGLSTMNVKRICNEIRSTLNDSQIEREVTKFIAQVINGFLQNIV